MNSTNSLSVNSAKSLPQNQTLVTTKELAAILNVDISTIQKTIKRLNETSDVLPKFTKGQTPKFNEEQATLIKQEIQKHHNLASRQIDNVSTELEENETVIRAISILTRRNNELKNQVELMQPKADVYDKICNSDSLISVDIVASNLGYGKNSFFALMRGMGIFYYSTKDADGKRYNLPKQEYKDRGYFVTKEEPYSKGDKDCLYTKIYVTGKGETWLAKKLKDETPNNYMQKAIENCPKCTNSYVDKINNALPGAYNQFLSDSEKSKENIQDPKVLETYSNNLDGAKVQFKKDLEKIHRGTCNGKAE